MSSTSLINEWTASSAKPVRAITGEKVSEDVTLSMRYHGRLFVIEMSISHFRNSPDALNQYLKYIASILPNDREFNGITDLEAFEWLANIFEPIFSQLAPNLPPSFNPCKISSGLSKLLLSKYLFPETFGCKLEAQDDKFIPVHVDNKGRRVKPRSFLNGNLLDELEI